MGALNRRLKLKDWANTLVVVSRFSTTLVSFVLIVCFFDTRSLSFVEMDAAKQKVRMAVARKKEEEKKAKGQKGTSSSVPAAISKGSAKRKVDGEDDRPPKKVVVSPGDVHPKKSPPKPGCGVGKGMMTLTGLAIEGPRCLLTHKDYAVEEVQSPIKPMDVDPCAELGTKELGVLSLFDLTQVNLFSWLISSPFFSLFFFLTNNPIPF